MGKTEDLKKILSKIESIDEDIFNVRCKIVVELKDEYRTFII